ncbi:MAG: VWA domain-containing protein [Acidimicrobiales bacterium]
MSGLSLRRCCALVAIGCCLVVGLVSAQAGAQEEPQELLIADVERDGRELEVTVIVPPRVDTAELGPASFFVATGGTRVVTEVEPVAGDDLEVVLVIDTSGSMQGAPLDAAKSAATQFTELMPAGTLVAVVGFGDEPVLIQDFTTDKQAVAVAVDGLVASGETALFAAAGDAAALFDPRSTALRNVILISDGGNTVDPDEVGPEVLLGRAQTAIISSDATFYAVSLTTSESDPRALAGLVGDSGGAAVAAEDLVALEGVFSDIASLLSNQVALAFAAEGSGPTDVVVRLDDQGVVAEATLRVQLPPVAAAPQPTATPAPLPTPADVSLTVTSPQPIQIEDPGRDWLRPFGIAVLAVAALILFNILLWPDKRRKNPLAAYAPVVARATSSGATGISRFPAWLTHKAEGLLDRSGRRARLAFKLESAGLQMRTSEFAVLVSLISITLFFVGALFSLLLGLVFLAGVLALVMAYLSVRTSRRRDAFASQLNATLQLLAGSLRTGYSLTQAIEVVASESEDPTADEFRRVTVEGHLGRDVVESLRDVVRRMDNEDLEWVANSIEITREIGGDLAEVIDNTAETIRSRERVRRHIKTLSAEGRISAIILLALPPLMAAWQFTVAPDYLSLLFETNLGRTLLIAAIAAVIIGSVWMRRITRLKF